MKILPISFNNIYKNNNSSKANIFLTKPMTYDSISFTNRINQETDFEKQLYDTALTIAKKASKIKKQSKVIIKKGNDLEKESTKIIKQSNSILNSARKLIENQGVLYNEETFATDKQRQKIGKP